MLAVGRWADCRPLHGGVPNQLVDDAGIPSVESAKPTKSRISDLRSLLDSWWSSSGRPVAVASWFSCS